MLLDIRIDEEIIKALNLAKLIAFGNCTLEKDTLKNIKY